LLLCGVALADDLCAVWNPQSTGTKCSPSQSCCVSAAPTPEVCTPPLTEGTSTFITQEDFQFASDGGYSITFILGTGTCPTTVNDGTVTTAVVTRGVYTIGGNNTNLGGDWKQLTYQATIFDATLTKTNKVAPFTVGTRLAGKQVGPCTDLSLLFNNASIGCPCGGNWTVTPFANGVSPSTRTINKTACDVNGTSSCPENYYFSVAPRYGSFRVYNVSNNTARVLEITRPASNQSEGWNDSQVYANFTANFTCPPRVTQQPPTMANSAAFALVPAFGVLFILW